jgi:hypothetical protein
VDESAVDGTRRLEALGAQGAGGMGAVLGIVPVVRGRALPIQGMR